LRIVQAPPPVPIDLAQPGPADHREEHVGTRDRVVDGGWIALAVGMLLLAGAVAFFWATRLPDVAGTWNLPDWQLLGRAPAGT
jgi:hypothetical protein